VLSVQNTICASLMKLCACDVRAQRGLPLRAWRGGYTCSRLSLRLILPPPPPDSAACGAVSEATAQPWAPHPFELCARVVAPAAALTARLCARRTQHSSAHQLSLIADAPAVVHRLEDLHNLLQSLRDLRAERANVRPLDMPSLAAALRAHLGCGGLAAHQQQRSVVIAGLHASPHVRKFEPAARAGCAFCMLILRLALCV
jgi:hypothetical protein